MDSVECFERLLLEDQHPTHALGIGGLVVDGVVQGAVHQLDDVVGDLHRLILSLEGGGYGR